MLFMPNFLLAPFALAEMNWCSRDDSDTWRTPSVFGEYLREGSRPATV